MPSFFAARFSFRRSLSVFCDFCLVPLRGLSELLLMTTFRELLRDDGLGCDDLAARVPGCPGSRL